jgi:hypothetical protein
MYCWGADMSDWARPSGYSFTGSNKARSKRRKAAASSKKRGGRSYQQRHAPDMTLTDPKHTISTESANPIVVAVDVTGSMSHWPGEIFDRLPLLYQTLSQYRDDVEVSFVAIGDATCDAYPLQVTDFASGIALEDKLAALYGEGGGGGGARESYELFAHFLLHHCRAPNATRPYLLLYGDEGFYEQVDTKQIAHYLGDRVQGPVDSYETWGAVAEAWNVFHLRKPYHSRRHDDDIKAQWASVLGEERIIRLDNEQRAVDLALGLIARSWGHYDDFETNMGARQSKQAVRDLGQRLSHVEALS